MQNGSNYASQYDVMLHEYSEFKNSKCGYDSEGGHIVLPMSRVTSILYFHLTSDLEETLQSATLTVEGGDIAAKTLAYNDSESKFVASEGSQTFNTITLTFEEGTAPSAKDFCLWYNILPVNATGLTLTVTTTSGKTATLTNTTGKNYAAGKLNKIVKSMTWEEGAKYYVKVTKDEELKNNGQYLIVYEMGETGLAFDGSLKTLDAVSNNVEVDIVDNKIVSSTKIDASAFTINVEEGTVLSASGLYIGVGSYTNGLATSGTPDYVHEFSFDGNGNAILGVVTTGGTMTLRYNKASNQDRFRYYKSGQESIALYLLEGTGTAVKPSANLSFPESDYEVTLGDAFTAPVLTNPNGVSVTYSSSDETVATVGTNGNVEILAAGKTIITATFGGNDSYKAGSATYTLTVIAPPTKVSDVIAGGAGNYTLEGVTVYVASAPNYIIGDATGRMVLYKSGISLTPGAIINVSGPVVDYNGLLEFSGKDVKVENTGETGTADHGTATAPSAEVLSVFNGGYHSAMYVSGSGTQNGRNITVGDIILYINPENTATDNNAVVFSGYVAAYNSSHDTYTFYQTSLAIDPSVATLEVSPKTLSWNANETDSKTVTVTLNANAAAGDYTYTPVAGDAKEWTITNNNGAFSVAPKAANTSTQSAKSITIRVSHTDNSNVYKDVVCTQDKVSSGGGVTPQTVTIKYSGDTGNMTGENDAATVGLDASKWSVVGEKGSSTNFPGLNKAGDIRLYYAAGGSNTITVTALEAGVIINSIEITYTGDNYSKGKVLVEGEEVSISNGSYPINSQSFVITNGNTSNVQVRISEVEITYTPAN